MFDSQNKNFYLQGKPCPSPPTNHPTEAKIVYVKDGPKEYVLTDELHVGMTSEKVKSLIGTPENINTKDKNEQWIYERPVYHNLYLYFEDDELVLWQE